jgi:hypothetical protein
MAQSHKKSCHTQCTSERVEFKAYIVYQLCITLCLFMLVQCPHKEAGSWFCKALNQASAQSFKSISQPRRVSNGCKSNQETNVSQ